MACLKLSCKLRQADAMRIFSILTVASICFAVGCQEKAAIKFPDYGFDFPGRVSAHDSNEFHYPLKDLLSTRDSIFSYEAHYLYNAFDEQNLSIGPAPVPTVRFIYESLSYPVIIKLLPDAIIVKQGYNGEFRPDYDRSKLSATEQLFFYYYFGCILRNGEHGIP
jgi:hypothetical protein